MTRRVPLSEAAAVLGVTPRRLRLLCQQGRVRGARLDESTRGPVWTVVLYDGQVRIEPRAHGPKLRG